MAVTPTTAYRVSRRGVFPNTFSMDHCGPLCRSAEDIALFLQAIAGFDPEDPGSEDVPVPDYTAALNDGVRGLRLGLVEDWYRDAPHPDVAPAIDRAGEDQLIHGARHAHVAEAALLFYLVRII